MSYYPRHTYKHILNSIFLYKHEQENISFQYFNCINTFYDEFALANFTSSIICVKRQNLIAAISNIIRKHMRFPTTCLFRCEFYFLYVSFEPENSPIEIMITTIKSLTTILNPPLLTQ